MTATDKLRQMLDERGVKWDYGITGSTTTRFGVNGIDFTFTPMRDGLVCSTILTPAQAVEATLGPQITGETSDGYHTFNELYHHRAVLFSVIVRDHTEIAWKAKKHHDGTMYEGMFIVGIDTPYGQASYHYDIDPYWDMFRCRELDRAPEWDGHTPDQAIERIGKLVYFGPKTAIQCALEEFTFDWCSAACGGTMTNHERDEARARAINGNAEKIAMLGRGECEDIGTDRFVCSKCGCTLDLEDAASCEPTMWVDGVAACPRFCPNCGMRVRR